MLKNITLLEKVKPLESMGYLHDNSDFRDYLKVLSPFFKIDDYGTISDDDKRTFFYNLLYVAQRDLSLAHCLQHNQFSRIAITCGPDGPAKEIISGGYSDIVCSYSSHRAMDTIMYDPGTNTLLPGTKGWLSNLKSADICCIDVPEFTNEVFSYAHKKITDDMPGIYTVFLDLRKIKHTRTDGTTSPTAAGMKGAAPGTLTLLEPVVVGTDVCYLLKTDPKLDLSYPFLSYGRQCWSTVHLGVILGLYKELLKCPEVNDPSLNHRLKTLEIEISSLKIIWEEGLNNIALDSRAGITDNPVMKTSQINFVRNTQYAASKKLLLDLIHFVLEVGLNQFVDDNTPQWTRFKDAISYVTHMASLYRCNNRYSSYNTF